jgi:hypothetical protein
MSNAKKAGELRVGDVVEFEIGSPVRVVEIEDNYCEAEPDRSEWALKNYGKSLVFSCVFDEGYEAVPGMWVQTLYVRRELSPVSGDRVCR